MHGFKNYFLCHKLIILSYFTLGPVCEDPGRPPDGMQMASSYEHGSEVLFGCERPGYIPYTTDPITCVKSKLLVSQLYIFIPKRIMFYSCNTIKVSK